MENRSQRSYAGVLVTTIAMMGIACLIALAMTYIVEQASTGSQLDRVYGNFSDDVMNYYVIADGMRLTGWMNMSICSAVKCSSKYECRRKVSRGEVFCKCGHGWSGDRCEIPASVAPCGKDPAPCSGHGECIDLNSTNYICLCHADHSGSKCEEIIKSCSLNPCLHGDCDEEVNGYKCICRLGHDGSQCQIDIDYCSSDPCGENGTCVDLQSTYTCICSPGYTGSDCHSICDDNPCSNNGTCTLCGGGVCNGTGLMFMCDCLYNDYGTLCTDSYGNWGSWSEWTHIRYVTYEDAFGFNLKLGKCQRRKMVRNRECRSQDQLQRISFCLDHSETKGLGETNDVMLSTSLVKPKQDNFKP